MAKTAVAGAGRTVAGIGSARQTVGPGEQQSAGLPPNLAVLGSAKMVEIDFRFVVIEHMTSFQNLQMGQKFSKGKYRALTVVR